MYHFYAKMLPTLVCYAIMSVAAAHSTTVVRETCTTKGWAKNKDPISTKTNAFFETSYPVTDCPVKIVTVNVTSTITRNGM